MHTKEDKGDWEGMKAERRCNNSARFSSGGRAPPAGGGKESNAGGHYPSIISKIALNTIIIEEKAT
jgi:hypothetical protein